MANARYLILVRRQKWRLIVRSGTDAQAVELPATGDKIDAETAREVRSVMREHGYGGDGIALGIPSEWALSARISTGRLPRHGRRQAMAFRLEEQLPLAAEEFVADFVEHAGTALGVAVEAERLGEMIGDLESAGIAVHTVTPTAMLVLQGLGAAGGGNGQGYALAALDGQVELAGFNNRRICAWQSVDDDHAAIARALQADLLSGTTPTDPLPLLAAGLNGRLQAAVAELADVQLQDVQDFVAETCAGRAAADVLAGRSQGWFDLRRDRLATTDRLRPIRRPLNVCIALGLALLCALAAGLLWRARRYRHAAARDHAEQAKVYEKLFPGEQVPAAVLSRLDGRLRKLSGLRGVSADVPQRASALETLRQFAARLPGSIRMRVLELQIEPAGVIVEGQSRSHADAEKIAAELRKGKVFEVESPRTERLVRGGVAFTLTARPIRAAKKGPRP